MENRHVQNDVNNDDTDRALSGTASSIMGISVAVLHSKLHFIIIPALAPNSVCTHSLFASPLLGISIIPTNTNAALLMLIRMRYQSLVRADNVLLIGSSGAF